MLPARQAVNSRRKTSVEWMQPPMSYPHICLVRGGHRGGQGAGGK